MFRVIKRSFAIKRSLHPKNSKCCSVIGAQWGHEGKEKLIDKIADNFNLCARFNGKTRYEFIRNDFASQIVPAGILHPNCKGVIGAGVLINPVVLLHEIKQVETQGISIDNHLFISER
jgi:adenylosuccinate synthase